MHELQTPAIQFEQFNAQQYPDCKENPGLQIEQFVDDKHELQPVEQLLHNPDDG